MCNPSCGWLFTIPLLERWGSWFLSLACPCLANGDACEEFLKFRVYFNSLENMQWRNVLLWNFLVPVYSLLCQVPEHKDRWNKTHGGFSPSTYCLFPFAKVPVFVAHREGHPSPGRAAHFCLHFFLFQMTCKSRFHVLSPSQAFCKIVLCNHTFFSLYWWFFVVFFFCLSWLSSLVWLICLKNFIFRGQLICLCLAFLPTREMLSSLTFCPILVKHLQATLGHGRLLLWYSLSLNKGINVPFDWVDRNQWETVAFITQAQETAHTFITSLSLTHPLVCYSLVQGSKILLQAY